MVTKEDIKLFISALLVAGCAAKKVVEDKELSKKEFLQQEFQSSIKVENLKVEEKKNGSHK